MVYVLSGLVTFIVALVIAKTLRLHGGFTADNHDKSHRIHFGDVPRAGSLALGAGLLACVALRQFKISDELWYVCASSFTLVGVLLYHDLSDRVPIAIRLLLSIGAAATFVFTSGYMITGINTPILKTILNVPIIASIVSIFAIAGLSQAINIIDGMNGLAAGACAIMFGTFAWFANALDDQVLLAFALIHLAIIAGFFPLNFPRARIFLGDAGAVYLGFALAALAIMMMYRHAGFSPWSTLLILSYPAIEICWSIYRRIMARDGTPGRADRIHLHHLFFRLLDRRILRDHANRRYANPLSSLGPWTLTLISCVFAMMSWKTPAYAILLVIIMGLIYLSTYATLALWALSRRKWR